MSTDSLPAPKPRWRPKFSLRTLMIGVLLLAFCWALTATLGVSRIHDEALNYFPIPRSDSLVIREVIDTKFNVKIQAWAPFYVHCSAGRLGRYNEQHWIWFFGYTRQLTPTKKYFNYDYQPKP